MATTAYRLGQPALAIAWHVQGCDHPLNPGRDANIMQFSDIHADTPTRASLDAIYAQLHASLDQTALAPALTQWDDARRAYETWFSLVHLRFSQNTSDAKAKADREYADALQPYAIELETTFKQRLLALPDQAGLAAAAGHHAVRLWQTDITTFTPAIAADLEEESRLYARYTEIIASAQIAFDGHVLNLSGLTPYGEVLDRPVRHDAETARWSFFAEHGEELDDLYDRLVKLRHGMALALDCENFIALGYRRMRRVDYDAADVAQYRAQVAEHVVPLVARIIEQRRVANGLDHTYAWDERLIDPAGNVKPEGDHDTLVLAAQAMFDGINPALADFYRMMRQGDFMDLKNRPGKAGGGFCTSFPTAGMPFIFANFNGTHHDVNVFTHEMGHAFQNYSSRNLPGIDYLWPTSESAEIHSMGLEFLTYPGIGKLVGEAQAARFRRMHLIGALEFLPYGVLVDHFQHEVYAHPDATPADRHAMWQRLEKIYLPWRDYGDLAYPAKGARWQAQLHIYGLPFYYIDYTLAQCCALQLWVKSRQDYAGSLHDYVELCARGGGAPFKDLVRSAGLASPFAPGALSDVVREAALELGVSH